MEGIHSVGDSGRKHAEAISLLLEAVTDNSAEELRDRNRIHEHQKQIDKLGRDYPSASAQARILMDEAQKEMAERQAVINSLMASITTLVIDRKREENTK
ncbi:MAG TPA: hypothetical protein VF867_14365 [Arthrobacter sp.]